MLIYLALKRRKKKQTITETEKKKINDESYGDYSVGSSTCNLCFITFQNVQIDSEEKQEEFNVMISLMFCVMTPFSQHLNRLNFMTEEDHTRGIL